MRELVASLPPAVLSHLTHIQTLRLSKSPLQDQLPLWKDALSQQQTASKPDIAPLTGARILAHHILYGTIRSTSLIRLGISLFRSQEASPFASTWRSSETRAEELEVHIQALRDSWTDTSARLDAVNSMSSVLRKALYWEHVENFLYHQIFSWPVLVLTDSPVTRAIGLPVGVDVRFDGKSDAVPLPLRGGTIESHLWKGSFRRSAEAARVLWLGKHGNYGTFRTEVESAFSTSTTTGEVPIVETAATVATRTASSHPRSKGRSRLVRTATLSFSISTKTT